MSPNPDTTQTVAVIAGGIAGLATALNIRDKAKAEGRDVKVTVFEKGSEPGGNLQTVNALSQRKGLIETGEAAVCLAVSTDFQLDKNHWPGCCSRAPFCSCAYRTSPE